MAFRGTPAKGCNTPIYPSLPSSSLSHNDCPVRSTIVTVGACIRFTTLTGVSCIPRWARRRRRRLVQITRSIRHQDGSDFPNAQVASLLRNDHAQWRVVYEDSNAVPSADLGHGRGKKWPCAFQGYSKSHIGFGADSLGSGGMHVGFAKSYLEFSENYIEFRSQCIDPQQNNIELHRYCIDLPKMQIEFAGYYVGSPKSKTGFRGS